MAALISASPAVRAQAPVADAPHSARGAVHADDVEHDARPSTTAGAVFRVTMPPAGDAQADGAKAFAGRLIVSVIREGAKLREGTQPVDGPFWDDPQPIFGMDVRNAAPGSVVTLAGDGQDVTGFPMKPAQLPAGTYRVQARLDAHRDSSKWRSEPGNWWSQAVDVTVPASGAAPVVEIALTKQTTPRDAKAPDGAAFVRVRSELLSAFRGKDVFLNAAVMLPVNYDAGRQYPAIYEVPGFGGDHKSGLAERIARRARINQLPEGDPARALAASAFWIILDPEGPNGHSLFADSANNGPCGRALIEELIPALEKQYPLVARPEARLLRGHSSGGWSTIWLGITYPQTFGAVWSTAPDPVDFRAFQSVNIYEQPSMYEHDGQDIPSYVRDGQMLMTIRQENGGEEVLGPDNTSAQQWDSWLAVFGPRNERGHPSAMYDAWTGKIDRAIAEQYRAYDISMKFRASPDVLGPIFRDRVRVVVGDADEFALHKAVALLKQDVDAWAIKHPPDANDPKAGKGSMRILPGLTHGSVLRSRDVMDFSRDMLEHLRVHDLAR